MTTVQPKADPPSGDGAALSAEESAVLAAIAARGAAMTEGVIAWSRIGSGSTHLPGLASMAGVLAEAFSALGATPALLPPAPVEIIDAQGRPAPAPRGQNLHLVVRPQAPRQVLLCGHMDTVFGADSPFQDVSWRAPGVLNGPGVADMKGGLMVMLQALLALEHSPWADQIGYQVVINADEEISSLGSAPLLAQAAANAQVGLVYEPATTPDGTLAAARKGLASFTLVARGVSAHAGRNPQDGRNAVLAVADFALAAAALSGAREGLSINIAKIEGGGPTNVVPDLALCRLEGRVAGHADRHWIEAQLTALAASVGRGARPGPDPARPLQPPAQAVRCGDARPVRGGAPLRRGPGPDHRLDGQWRLLRRQ